MNDAQQLIERLRVERPSRELADAVLRAVRWTVTPCRETGCDVWTSPDGKYRFHTNPDVRGIRNRPDPTRDIRFAMTLIPDGWRWSISNRATPPHHGRAYINNKQLITLGGGFTPNPKYRGYEATAATAELAICIVVIEKMIDDDKLTEYKTRP